MLRILDLFGGAGGAGKGYKDAGFEIVGVDIDPQPNYPYEFIQADAIEFLRMYLSGQLVIEPFDGIHASPPCQRWSFKTKHADRHPDLIEPLRPLLEASRLPYVIENVEGAPLRDPVMLCGSSFGLSVRRHRLFETNWDLHGLPCIHDWQLPRYELYDHKRTYLSGVVHVFGTGGGKGKEHWNEAMEIDWMSRKEQVEAIPPAFTKFIGAQLRAHIESRHLAGSPPIG